MHDTRLVKLFIEIQLTCDYPRCRPTCTCTCTETHTTLSSLSSIHHGWRPLVNCLETPDLRDVHGAWKQSALGFLHPDNKSGGVIVPGGVVSGLAMDDSLMLKCGTIFGGFTFDPCIHVYSRESLGRGSLNEFSLDGATFPSHNSYFLCETSKTNLKKVLLWTPWPWFSYFGLLRTQQFLPRLISFVDDPQQLRWLPMAAPMWVFAFWPQRKTWQR